MKSLLRTRLRPRQIGLLAALIASIGACSWIAANDDDATDAPAVTARRLPPPSARKTDSWPAPPAPRGSWSEAPEIALNSWGLESESRQRQKQQLAQVQAAPPRPPPPLNFQAVGRMDDGKPRVVFTSPLRTEVLGVGELLDRQWRVTAIDPQAVQLTHLRTGQQRTLPYPAFSPS